MGRKPTIAPTADFRFGRWEVALDDVDQVDALITDTPYSAKTHAGHNRGAALCNRVAAETERRLRSDGRRLKPRASLNYAHWTPRDVEAFVDAWAPRTRGWFVALTDHVLAPVWDAALQRHGRYTFSPLTFLHPGSRVRQRGDGPAQWATQIVVARPRTVRFARWGALDGGYVLPRGQPKSRGVVGGKPLWLMRALVRDYARPGDLVCDPCAGGATTLLAALLEGRRAVGAERLRAHYNVGRARLEPENVRLEGVRCGRAPWPRTTTQLAFGDLATLIRHGAAL